MHKVKKKR